MLGSSLTRLRSFFFCRGKVEDRKGRGYARWEKRELLALAMHRLRRLGLGYFDMSAGKKGIRTGLMGRSPYRLLGFLTLTGRSSRIHSYFSCLPFYPPERRVRPRVHAVTLSPTSRPSLFFQLIHLPILGMNTDSLMTPFCWYRCC